MASTRRVVTLNGLLTGEGLESICTISAEEVTHVGTGQTALCKFDIQSVAKSLPEGRYKLLYNGTQTTMRHERGLWLAG